MQALPVLDSWIWQEEEGMIKKVQEYPDGEYYINLHTGILFAYLYDRNQVYLDWAPPVFQGEFRHCDEDIREGLDLQKGYGVYSLYVPFNMPLSTDCIVLLRRPGREDEKVIFYELLQKPFKNSLAGSSRDTVHLLTKRHIQHEEEYPE